MLFTVGINETNAAGHPIGHGTWSVEFMWDLGLKDHPELEMHDGPFKFRIENPVPYEKMQQDLFSLTSDAKSALPLYYATGTSLRATACDGIAIGTGGCCLACSQLANERSLRKRAQNFTTASKNGKFSNGTNRKHTSLSLGKVLMDKARAKQVKEALCAQTCKNQNVALRKLKKLACALNNTIHAAERKDWPKFIQNFCDAYEVSSKNDAPFGGGLLSKALEDILEGMSVCLKNGTTRGRQLTSNEQLFYAALLNTKGPWAHNFVSGVLLGPNERTSKQLRSELASGFDPSWAPKQVAQLFSVLKEFRLEDAPGVISEDATTLLRRIDLQQLVDSELLQNLHIPANGLAIRVHGLDGPPPVVTSTEEL